jgi:hypothetical protein
MNTKAENTGEKNMKNVKDKKHRHFLAILMNVFPID